MCIEVLRYLELPGSYLHLKEPVERVHVRLIKSVLAGENIPALLEFTEAPGFEHEFLLFWLPVALVDGLQHAAVADGLDDRRQVFLAGRDIFEDNAVLESRTLVQKAVKAERLEHPLANIARPDYLLILYLICISVPAVAYNLDSEDVVD